MSKRTGDSDEDELPKRLKLSPVDYLQTLPYDVFDRILCIAEIIDGPNGPISAAQIGKLKDLALIDKYMRVIAERHLWASVKLEFRAVASQKPLVATALATLIRTPGAILDPSPFKLIQTMTVDLTCSAIHGGYHKVDQKAVLDYFSNCKSILLQVKDSLRNLKLCFTFAQPSNTDRALITARDNYVYEIFEDLKKFTILQNLELEGCIPFGVNFVIPCPDKVTTITFISTPLSSFVHSLPSCVSLTGMCYSPSPGDYDDEQDLTKFWTTIASNTKLQALDISDTSIPDKLIIEFPNLRRLCLSASKQTEIVCVKTWSTIFERMPSLIYLDLNAPIIKTIKPPAYLPSIIACTQLQQFHCGTALPPNFLPIFLKTCPGVHSLSLQALNDSDVSVITVSPLQPMLKTLSLRKCQITSLSLIKFTNVEVLKLDSSVTLLLNEAALAQLVLHCPILESIEFIVERGQSILDFLPAVGQPFISKYAIIQVNEWQKMMSCYLDVSKARK